MITSASLTSTDAARRFGLIGTMEGRGLDRHVTVGPDGLYSASEVDHAVAVRRAAQSARRRAPWRNTTPAQAEAWDRAIFADRARDEQLRSQVVLDTGGQVHDGLGTLLGWVERGQTLQGHLTWFLRPLARAAHADQWDLPHDDNRERAARRLATGDFTL